MANLQYIGARYVPKLYTNSIDGSSDWESGVGYESLTIVTYLDDSYTSKKTVPGTIGNPADNPDYWVKTGNFNAALIHIQDEIGHGSLNTDADNLIDAINEVLNDIPYVVPEMFGAKGDGVNDDTIAFQNAIDYAHTNNIPLKFRKIRITAPVRFYGDISGGELILINGATVITSAPRDEAVSVSGITFDVSNFIGTALQVKSDQTNIANCKFIGEATPADVTAIKIMPYIDASELFYENTNKGLWGIHVTNNYFNGVKSCIVVRVPDDDLAWISDLDISDNSGRKHYNAIDIECENVYAINNCNGVAINNNAFNDSYFSDTIRYGLRAINVNGSIDCINSKFFSDGDDTHYYGYYYKNQFAENKVQNNAGVLYDHLRRGRFRGLHRTRGTDGLESLINGLTQNLYYSTYPNLYGAAKNVIFENTGITSPAIVAYADNELTYTEDGTHTNVLVTIPLPDELKKETDHIYYMVVGNFPVTTNRAEVFQVNGSTRTFESLRWPGEISNGTYISGGMVSWDTPEVLDTIRMRFANFPAGTYKVKNVIIFTDMLCGLPDFTHNYTKLDMFN